MITFEFEEPKESRCECCGNKMVRVTGFVYKDGDAFAVYYAQCTYGHNERCVSGIIGLGEWSEAGGPEDRVAFPFQIWADESNFNVSLVNAAESPWGHVALLGRILGREEALKHEWLPEVFHITDHLTSDDPEIRKYFSAVGG